MSQFAIPAATLAPTTLLGAVEAEISNGSQSSPTGVENEGGVWGVDAVATEALANLLLPFLKHAKRDDDTTRLTVLGESLTRSLTQSLKYSFNY